jgi:hypothetical protein
VALQEAFCFNFFSAAKNDRHVVCAGKKPWVRLFMEINPN